MPLIAMLAALLPNRRRRVNNVGRAASILCETGSTTRQNLNERADAPMYDVAKPSPDSKAQDAFIAYAALQGAQRADPALADNAYFQALLDSAYARFLILYERNA